MEIKINNDKPWFNQIDEFKIKLIRIALETNTKENAAKLLGISERSLRNKLTEYVELKEFKREELYTIDKQMLIGLFEMGYTLKQLSDKFKRSTSTIRRILKTNLGDKKYKILLKQTKGKKKMETNEIIENNRQLVSIIAEKIRENKMDELTASELFYAKILHSNRFINQSGEVTELGKEALYN